MATLITLDPTASPLRRASIAGLQTAAVGDVIACRLVLSGDARSGAAGYSPVVAVGFPGVVLGFGENFVAATGGWDFTLRLDTEDLAESISAGGTLMMGVQVTITGPSGARVTEGFFDISIFRPVELPGDLIPIPGSIADELDARITALEETPPGSAAGVASFNGRTGAVTATKADVGLSNVDNTADSAKPVSTAQASAISEAQAAAIAACRPISYVPTWGEVTGKPGTFPPDSHSHAWEAITGKPTFGPFATGTDAAGLTGSLPLAVFPAGSGLQVLRRNAANGALEWATISAGGGDMLKSENLSGLTDYATARTNLGLGTSATQASTAFAAASHTHAQSEITDLVADLAAKASTAALSAHTGNTSNPHGVTKAQVGLGSVDNTSDLSKPISTATQTALDGKQATLSNAATLAKITESGGAPLWDGGAWPGGSSAPAMTDAIALAGTDTTQRTISALQLRDAGRKHCDGDAGSVHFFEHFVMGTVALPSWLIRTIGSTLSANYSSAQAGTGDAFGRVYAYPNGGVTGFGLFNGASLGVLRPEGKTCELTTRLQLASATDANNLWAFGGFIDNVTPAAAEPANGVYFKASHNATIKLICRASSVETSLDTGQSLVSDGAYRVIKLRYTTSAVAIFIDGVDYGTVTTNIPTARCYAWWVTQRAGSSYPACAWDFVQLDMY